MTVRFFATLRDRFGARREVDLARAQSVEQLVQTLGDSPTRERELRDSSGRLRKDIVFLVNGRNIIFLGGAETRLRPGDSVDVFPPVFGG